MAWGRMRPGRALLSGEGESILAIAPYNCGSGVWRPTVLACLLLALALGCADKSAQSPQTAEALFQLGKKLMAKKDYVRAKEVFERIISSYPGADWVDDARIQPGLNRVTDPGESVSFSWRNCGSGMPVTFPDGVEADMYVRRGGVSDFITATIPLGSGQQLPESLQGRVLHPFVAGSPVSRRLQTSRATVIPESTPLNCLVQRSHDRQSAFTSPSFVIDMFFGRRLRTQQA